MRRPTRTRRLSIAALASSLVFVVIASAGIRSFWRWDAITNHYGRDIRLEAGHITYRQMSDPLSAALYPRARHIAWKTRVSRESLILWPRIEIYGNSLNVCLPLWPVLLLLLIAPARWVTARPIGGPAFPVVTDGKEE